MACVLMLLAAVFAEAKTSKDAGLLFLDEVSREIVVDMKSGGKMAEHAFSDLEGRLKPGTNEYQALLHVIEQEMKADKNIEVPSLSELRKKYDEAFLRLAMVAEPVSKPEVASLPAEEAAEKPSEPRASVSLELQFSVIPEAGYTNPSLKGYRLIPLETGAMLVSESGDKRVFGFRDAKEGDDFEVSVGEIVDAGSLLALRRKDSVWIIHLSRAKSEETLKIDWSKRLEFPLPEADSLAAQGLKITIQDQAIAVESGPIVKRLASANGHLLLDAVKADDVLSSEPVQTREPASPAAHTPPAAGDSSIVQPIED